MTCPQCVHDFAPDDAVTVTKWTDGPEGWHFVHTAYCSQKCVAKAMVASLPTIRAATALLSFRTALHMLASDDINTHVNLCDWGMDDFSTGGDDPVNVDIQQMREMAMAILGKMQGATEEKRRVA